MKRIFMLLAMVISLTTVFSQNIIRGEYFIDLDPGPGNGTAIPAVTTGDIVNFSFDISTSGLTPGFHFLNTRVADADGKWSRYETRIFYLSSAPTTNTTNITGAEYFIDSDTATGSGIPINIGTPGSLVNFTVLVPAGLSPGFHSLGIRVRDQEGKWSLFEERSFYLSGDGPDAPPIVAAEYFYNVDPGIGNASPLVVNPTGNIITQTFLIPVPASLSQGEHVLGIRVKNQQGHWSFYAKDTITVSNSATISCPSNVVVAAPGGQCTAVVNNIDPIVAPAGTSYTYTLTGATLGTGTGTASGKNFNAGVTTVTYALNSSPSTNCSFTVTVNTDVTPVINLNASATDICPGQQVVFTTVPFNGGATPSYQWKLNGNNIPGATNSAYQSTSLANGDIVSVIMTSSLSCANPQSDLSNEIFITVSSSVPAMVSLGMSATTICTGTPVNFIATPTNGGTSPTYQWKLNGNIIPGAAGPTYQSSTLANGDQVSVTMTSSLACANPQTATMTGIAMTVTPTLSPSVYLESPTTICAGELATFYASPGNGGTTPSYQWKVNGNNVGSNSNTYSSSSLNNGDIVTVVMTSSLGCASPQSATSDPITMTVLPSSPATVNINASSTTICPGTSVTFNVTAVTIGASYQWQLNGNNIPGATGMTYQSSSLQNGDKIKVIMTQSSPCLSSSQVASNEITMTVDSAPAPTVTISASATAVCSGQTVTFTALPNNAGNNPVYEWTLNNNAVGSNSPTFQCSTLVNGDNVRVTMAPSQSCGTNTPVVSNTITMTVGADVTPSVTMSAENSTACTGTLAIFHASPISGAGSSPTYQWKRNGVNIPGATNSTYQSSSLQNGDVIRVAMTSSLSCANPQTVLSHDSVTMILSSIPLTPSVTISASVTAICQGQTVLFTAVPTNGGEVPGYQWKLNGINVGDNIDTFSTNSLQHGDKVTVEMATSVTCSTNPTATSAPVTMTVTTVTIFYADLDGDGYGNGASGVAEACTAPAGYVSNSSDCNDDNASVHPGATEICGNSIDDDCDGQVDETCGSPDNDGDGYTIAQGDCNDNNASINPGATEICGNGIDDNCNGSVDENCNNELPVLLVKTNPVKEGDAGYTILNVEVKLDSITLSPVSVNYTTSNANATAGLDYVATNGVLTIPAGAVSGSIQVRIIGDLLSEHNESFWINFSNPVNVLLGGDPRTRIMIIDDDKGKSSIAAHNAEVMKEQVPLKIPTVTKRNQVWMIPQIGNYENEVLIMNVQGQVINRFINYKNQTSVGNVATGLYFYRIRITESSGQHRFYSGRLLITE